MAQRAELRRDYRKLGVILIIVGVFGFLLKASIIGWVNVWPLLMIGGGIGAFSAYFKRRQENGLLMLGTILTIYGFLFLYCSSGNWGAMEFLWPTFVLAPGIGFFVMFYLGKGDRGLIVPGTILIGVSILFYFKLWDIIRWWPLFLILIGIYLLVKKSPSREVSPQKDEVNATEEKEQDEAV